MPCSLGAYRNFRSLDTANLFFPHVPRERGGRVRFHADRMGKSIRLSHRCWLSFLPRQIALLHIFRG